MAAYNLSNTAEEIDLAVSSSFLRIGDTGVGGLAVNFGLSNFAVVSASAVGRFNTGTTTACSAFGQSNMALANAASAFGAQNVASGTVSTAVGYLNSVAAL